MYSNHNPTMNDCQNIILSFLSSKELFSLSREHMFKCLPSTLTINSFEEYEQFKKWGALFNPTNITTVKFNITYPIVRFNGLSYNIGYVPHCVKNVEILKFDSISPLISISLPNTVEYLKIDNTLADINNLSDGIKHLILGYNYGGAITHFNRFNNSSLEIVELYGYCGGGRFPSVIDDLPDTIHTMKMYVEFPAQINHWPANAQVVLEDPYEDDTDNLQLLPPNLDFDD